MGLTLKIDKGGQGYDGTRSQVVVPTDKAFNIGRGRGSDWVLLDPNEIISRQHCKIEFMGDGYYLTDISRHGVTVDGDRVEKHSPERLDDGSVLGIGDYEISVAITEGSEPPFVSTAGATRLPGSSSVTAEYSPPFQSNAEGVGEDDPFGVFRQPDALSKTIEFTESKPDRPIGEPVFGQESRPPEKPLAGSGGGEGGLLLDPDWMNKTGRRPQMPSPTSESLPTGAPILPTGNPTVITPPLPPANTEPTSKPVPDVATPVEAFLRGAGLPVNLLQSSQQLRAMELAGAVFRETVSGLISLLEAKHDFKEILGVDRTRLGNLVNPLKAGSSVEMVIRAMLTDHELFMPSVEAVNESLTQIKCHEIALLAGMKAAEQQLLKTFDPKRIADEVEAEASLGEKLIAGRRARCWEAFKSLHQDIINEMDEESSSRFMRAFAHAYNEQLRRCG